MPSKKSTRLTWKPTKFACRARITGGGAVYHDLGNLNFSFISSVERYDLVEIKKYALPVAKALAKIGVKAEISGRNDMTIDGKKFSGTAQALHRKKLLYHGTLLFNSDLSKLGQALNVQADKIQSKGIKSVRSRVTNIRDYLPNPEMTIQDFQQALLNSLFDEQPYREYRLTARDLERVTTLEKEKFSTWRWIYGESPPYNYKQSKRFAGGQVEVQLNVVKGLIQSCKFYGDFLGLENVETVERSLLGKRYMRAEVDAALSDLPLELYFGGISKEELLSCLFE